MSTVRDLLPLTEDGVNIIPTLVVVLLGFFTFLLVKTRRPAHFPPGPPSVPLLGSIPFLKYGGSQYYKEFSRQAERYGGIFSIALGHTWVVVLNSYDIIKEALVMKGTDFAGRIYDPRQDLLYNKPGETGIIDGDYSPEWTKQRNTTLTIMRNLGWGKHSIEQKMADEREVLLAIFREAGGKPLNPAPIINTSVANIICSMLFGHGFAHGDKTLQELIGHLDSLIALLSMDFEWDYVPLVSSVIPGTSYYRKLLKDASTGLLKFLSGKIEERRERLKNEPDDEPRDFIEFYLKELMALETKEKEKVKISKNWLENISLDFFIAGSETTTTTLKWGLIYMQHFPEVQYKVQAELDEVMGKPNGHGVTSLEDRKRLPYTDATIMEVQRISAIVATALVHNTTKDVNIQGYNLPKGTQVRYNVHAVMNDPVYWSDPEQLRPERFLGEDGMIKKNERWIPFGMGRRNCLGEQLARQELFMFFTAMLHNFSVRLPKGAALPSLEPGISGVILIPASYVAVFEPRFR